MRVLLIEDNADDATLFKRAVYPWDVALEINLGTALQRLGRETFDVVVLDPGLPDSPSPVEAWRAIRGAAINLPIVALSGCWDEKLARVLSKEGTSYIEKNRIGAEARSILINNVDSFRTRAKLNRRSWSVNNALGARLFILCTGAITLISGSYLMVISVLRLLNMNVPPRVLNVIATISFLVSFVLIGACWLVISLMSSFSARVYGRRSAENAKKKREAMAADVQSV